MAELRTDAEHVQPVRARHVEVQQDEVDVTPLQHLDRGGAVGGFEHLETLAGPDLAQQLPNLLVVVNQQQQRPRLTGGACTHI